MIKAISSRIAIALFAVVIGFTMTAGDADARLGGGRSFGKQSGNVMRREAPAQPGVPAQKQNNANPAPVQQPPVAAPQPQRNRWLGPIAGIAAGLGIAALMSHFGFGGAMGEMMGSLLLIGGLLIAGIFVFRLLRRSAPSSAPQPAYSGADATSANAYRFDVQQPAAAALPATTGPVSVTGEPLRPLGAPATTTIDTGPASTATWSVPADFDVDAFIRSAKVYFVRLQAAWDASDQADIREFTTPEMFAEIKLNIAERGAHDTHTDVVELEAALLGLEDDGFNALASVRFHGLIRESRDAPAAPFVEVWNLVKPVAGKQGWLLAGIQQEQPATVVP